MAHIKIIGGGTRAQGNKLSVSAIADFSYQLHNEDRIFDEGHSTIKELIGKKKALFVISPTVYEIYGEWITKYLHANLEEGQYSISVTPSTELNKTMESVLAICEQAKSFKLDRDGCFIAIGGGIVMDMVGFAASMYRRGTKFIKIPTTLVGQVDVAVGVKTGVNFRNSKNMLGTYYPAFATLNCKSFLRTLPLRELRCGMAEVIKMGLVCDATIFNDIEEVFKIKQSTNIAELDYDIYERAMLRMIEELQPNLLEVELERLVDFGHTFSMRFETCTDHLLLHGEAVSIDMALSSCLSYLLGHITKTDYLRIIWLLETVGLPVFDEKCCTLENLLESLEEVSLHRIAINLVIPTAIGKGKFVKDIDELPEGLLLKALKQLRQSASCHQAYSQTSLTLLQAV